MAGYEAARLFIDRARAARADSTATDRNALALVEICRRLDGIPLAIELAAARVRVFSVEQIAARLDDRFHLLAAGPRTALPHQQTLRATVDWSYALLSEEAEPRLRGAKYHRLLDRLEEEHDNLRTALGWSLTPARGDGAALRLSGALAWFWWLRSYHDEGRRWLARALGGTSVRSAARMKALHGAGWLAQHQRDPATARRLLAECLQIAHQLDDQWTLALALHHLGRVAYYDGDPTTARSLARESLAVAEDVGDPWLIAWPLHLLGIAAHIEGDYSMARDHYKRSLAMRRALGYQEGIGVLLALLAMVALRESELSQAHARLREALAVMQPVVGPWGLAPILGGFSRLATALGQPVRAVRLGAFATALGEAYHTPLIPFSEALLTEGLDMVRQRLGQVAYAAAWAGGTAMSLDQAVAEALAVEVAPPAPQPDTPRGGPFDHLTPAEVQVLRLLAAGRTTKEIAAALVVAVSTVDRHITHIYAKLGARNRAEATAFALKHGLAQTD